VTAVAEERNLLGILSRDEATETDDVKLLKLEISLESADVTRTGDERNLCASSVIAEVTEADATRAKTRAETLDRKEATVAVEAKLNMCARV